MASRSSVTEWIERLAAGDPAAAQKLWESYFHRLVGLARQKLQGTPRRAADEEDVALSAFDSFCRGAAQGRFPQLRGRDNLWPLLVLITARKAVDLVHHELRQKRGGGKVRHETALGGAESGASEAPLARVAGPEPTPEFAAQLAEEFQRLLDRLEDPQLRAVALWKMEGYTNDEIADKLGRSRPTVERKIKRIRSLWEDETRP